MVGDADRSVRGDHPPSDELGFLEFARSLPVSIIYDAIRAAEPSTPIKTHRATQNRLRRYERAKALPENFLLLGDAVCAFNPVYGQGMTTAALGAMTLQKCLREQNGNLEWPFATLSKATCKSERSAMVAGDR